MTKAAALQEFFSGFGMMAYIANKVPDDAVFPYLAYTPITSAWGEGPVSLTVYLWFHTESEKIPNAKAEEISKAIGDGCRLLCDGGAIRLYRGSPWCENLTDDVDKDNNGRYINVTAVYDTLY